MLDTEMLWRRLFGMTSKLSLGKKAVGHTGSYGLSEMATEWDSKH